MKIYTVLNASQYPATLGAFTVAPGNSINLFLSSEQAMAGVIRFGSVGVCKTPY